MKLRAVLYPVVLLLLFRVSGILNAQETADEEPAKNVGLEILIEQAMATAGEGDWKAALALLDEAHSLYPDDPRPAEYRASIVELESVDDSQSTWSWGDPTVMDGEEKESLSETDESPKFVIDRSGMPDRIDPGKHRDMFRLTLGWIPLIQNRSNNQFYSTMTSLSEALLSAIRLDAAFWFPSLGKTLGLALRYEGVSWFRGTSEGIYNNADLGIQFRTLLLESPASRLELGLDIGVSLHTLLIRDANPQFFPLAFFGLTISDPLFFHLFSISFLEPLIIQGGLRFYSKFQEKISLESIAYKVDVYWRFSHWHIGIGWNMYSVFVGDSSDIVQSLSIAGGVQF